MKKLLLLLVIAILPFGARAENISSNMYVAPASYDTNHPAPITNATPSYGRVNIDVDDQSHAASTAYVKGAYNSAIAAVNKVGIDKQPKLVNMQNNHDISTTVWSDPNGVEFIAMGLANVVSSEEYNDMYNSIEHDNNIDLEDTLISAGTTLKLLRGVGQNKQPRMYNVETSDGISDYVLSASSISGTGDTISDLTNQEYSDLLDDVSSIYEDADNMLMSAEAVLQLTHEMGTKLKDETDAIGTTLNSKRVKVFTTWDDDTGNAAAYVPLTVAPAH